MPVTHRSILTSEAVSAGHPGKARDRVAQGILDACLAHNPLRRVSFQAACHAHPAGFRLGLSWEKE